MDWEDFLMSVLVGVMAVMGVGLCIFLIWVMVSQLNSRTDIHSCPCSTCVGIIEDKTDNNTFRIKDQDGIGCSIKVKKVAFEYFHVGDQVRDLSTMKD